MNGGGSFNITTLANFRMGNTNSMTLEDIDGDSDIDIVLSLDFDQIIWLENDGNGNFTEDHYISKSAYSVVDVQTMDIGNDGYQDIVYSTNYGRHVSYLRNTMGDFTDQRELDRVQGGAIIIGDFNNDTLDDLVVSTPHVDDFFPYYQSPTSSFGKFQTIWNFGTESIGNGDTLDFENDGFQDVVFVKDERIHRLSNNAGVLAEYPGFTIGNGFTSVSAGDVNLDGFSDLITTSGNAVGWHESLGNGDFAPYQVFSGSIFSGNKTLFADMNNDSINDVIASGTSQIGIFLGQGAGVYQPVTLTTWAGVSSMQDMEVADMDNDGDLDIIVIDASTGSLIWMENMGNLLFNDPVLISSNLAGGRALSIADFDLDSDMDIVACAEDSRTISWFENLYVSPNQARGTIFIDLNNNGVQDSTDIPMSFTQVTSQPQSAFAFTYASGEYFMNFSDTANGYYTIFPEAFAGWGITTDSLSYTFLIDSNFIYIDSLDFGMAPLSVFDSIQVDMTIGQTTCDQESNLWIGIDNLGTTFPSGIVHLILDDSVTFVNSNPLPDSIVGQSVYWSYDSLFYFGSESITVNTLMPSFLSMGDVLTHTVETTVDSMGIPVFQAFDTIAGILTCAYDPNHKSVLPEGIDPDGMGYVESTTTELEYLIQFQNTGTDTATTVVIRDQLSEYLNWASLDVISVSHNYQLDVTAQGELIFTFEDINLPDSNVNFLGSQGYVKFTIDINNGVTIPAVIENTAEIYFDANPPIYTNTEVTTLYSCSEVMEGLSFPTAVCKGDPVFIDTPGQSTLTDYAWDLDGVYTQSTTDFFWEADTVGTFNLQLTITNAFCTGDTTVSLIVNNTNVVEYSPPMEICPGDSALIFNNYQQVGGVYYDTLLNVNACDSVLFQILNVHPETIIDLSGNTNVSLCLNSSPVQLTAIPSGGVFSGSGVSANEFIPSQAGVGSHTVQYSYVDEFSCSSSEEIQIEVDSCLSLNENYLEDFYVYPNPTSEKFTIEFESEFTGKVSLIGVDGKVLMDQNLIAQSKQEIDITELPVGIYWIRVSNDLYIKTVRVLKQ